ncbi:conserved exported hypothetical protein [Tenacibaculum sediminilitoris]|uniref:T9SS type A sorting domain-containing protein n=1 Tax=Tenacibaculum sediminilitoris TaxID=1820334 RepID=UPI003894F912
MKRNILLILFLFFSIISQAQTYTIKVNGYIGQGSSSCGSNKNGLGGIKMFFSDGTTKYLRDPAIYGLRFINQSYSHEATFNVSKKVTKVEFHTITRRNGTFGCKSSKEAWIEVSVTSPCFYKQYQKDEVYKSDINTGWARISIKPNASLSYPDGSSTSKVKTVCASSSVRIKATSGFTPTSDVYVWEFYDPVNTETRTHPDYQDLLNAVSSAEAAYDSCVRRTGDFDRCEGFMMAVFEAKRNLNNYTGPKTIQVSVWRTITNKTGQATIDLKLANLYSSTTDRNKALTKNINIRVKPSCNSSFTTNTVTVQFLPDAPQIAKAPTIKQPTCSYSTDADFKLYFTRQIFSYEKIDFNLLKKTLTNEYVAVDNNTGITSFVSSGGYWMYDWRPTSGTLTSGDYRVEVTGFNRSTGSPLCEKYSYDFQIKSPPKVVFSASKVKNETCYNSKDGEIKITGSGGSGSFYYSLNNGSTWSSSTFSGQITISGLSPANYVVRIKDTKGCIDKNKTSQSITISGKSKIIHTLPSNAVTHPSAVGSTDASIKINSVSGGTPFSNYYNYTVLLNGSTTNTKSGRAYVSGFVIPNLPAGTHKIRYTDKNNCTQEYTLPKIINPQPIALSVSSVKPNCYQGRGRINVTSIEGGYPNYTVILKRGSTVLSTLTGITNSTSFNIEAGNYTVLVKDTRQGSLEKSIAVIEQSEVAISRVSLTTPIKCKGGNASVSVTAIGGKSNTYQYAVYKSSGILWQNSNVFSLPANTTGYRFIVRDKNITTCRSKVSSSIIITEPLPIEIISSSVKHNNVFEGASGEILLVINGGTPSYTVTWKKKNDTSFSKTGNPATGLRAGFYTAIVKDKNGCEITSNEIEVRENPQLLASLTISKTINCKGEVGSLVVNSSGGSNSYSYKWFRGGTELIGKTTNQLTNISKGNYSVTINDGFTTISKSITLTEPSAITLNITKTAITCYGAENGKIKLAIGGGIPPYEYSIDDQTSFQTVNSLVDNTIDGLTIGRFTVWVRDSKGCIVDTPANAIINEPSEIKTDSFSITNCETAGKNEGAITITTSGGEGAHSYEWTKEGDASFTMNTKNINNLFAGIYRVVIRDAKGCEITQSYEVKEPLPIQVAIKITKTILCNGEETGELLAEVTGGYPINSTAIDFDYKWYDITSGTPVLLNSDVKLNQINNLKAGSYRVVVNDIKGATTQNEITINQPLKIEVNLASSTNVSCFGGIDGSIDITILGGTKPYSFSWKSTNNTTFNKTTEDITALREGTYYVEVVDSNGCTFTSSNFTIEQPLAALEISSYMVNNLTGFETKNGSISVDVVGGTPGYTYEWRQKGSITILGTTNPFENIAAGEYELTVKDANGCITTGSYTVIEPDLLVIDAINQQGNIPCFGDNTVSLTVKASGGVPPYSYSWKLKGGAVELGANNTLSNIGAGTYVITVTDKNGNIATKEYEVKEPLQLEIIGITKVDVSCNGGTDGSIDVSVSGGTAPYTYSWKHGVVGKSLNSLQAGTYEVVVRDKNLCEVTRKITIQEPTILAIGNSVIKDVTGFGLSNGEISINVVGGTPNYTYEWKDSSGIVQGSTTSKLSGVKAGEYSVKVTDTKGCLVEKTYTVNEPELLTVNIREASILCKNGVGILTAEVKGGVTPYMYSWKLKGNTTILSTTNVLEDVGAGIYVVTITDKSGNRATKEYELTEPLLLEITGINKVDVACYGGTDGYIDITVSGGVAPYTYSWNHTSLDAPKVEGLSSGTYSVVVTDKNGCKTAKETTINQPEKYDITNVKLIRPTSNLVDNGSIEVIFVGGVAPYSFEWKNEKGDIVSTKVSNDLSDKIENLAEGIYTITIKDAEDCVIEETYNLASPGELLVEITQVQEVKCHDTSNGILDVITVGGVGGNNYAWYNADNNELLGIEKQLKNISAGNYYVVVSNAEGIEERSSVFIVSQPTEIQLTIKEIDLNCFKANDGSFEVEVQGGTGNYEFRYRDVSSFSDWTSVVDNIIKVTNLEKNIYTLQVRDANNCLALNTDGSSDFTIEITQPLPLSISNELVKDVTGFGLSNGSISVDVVGGTPPYIYEWKEGSGTTILRGTNQITSIPTGNYKLITTDSKGCTLIKDYIINQPLKLEADIVRTSVISCKGEEDGALTAKVTGGVGGYTYKWYKELSSPLQIGTLSSVSGLGYGTYYVEVEDSNGNKVKSALYNLKEPEVLALQLSSDYTLCGTGNDWTVNTIVTGGTAPYTYLWNTGSNEPMLQDVVIGEYNVMVVDVNGCRTSETIKLTLPQAISIINETITKPTCFQGNDGSIVLEVIGGAPPYEYTWSNSKTGKVVTGLTSGEYSVEIKDSKGCAITKSFTVQDPDPIELDLGDDVTLCANQTYILDGTIINGVEYSWSSTSGFTSNKAVVEVQEEGVYTVIAKDNKGCVVEDSIDIIRSKQEISADLAVSTQVFTDESFVVVNISSVVADEVIWILPNEAIINESNDSYTEIKFAKEGEYEVTMITRIGNCEAMITKKVIVIDREIIVDEEDQNNASPMIKNLVIYPNPSLGKFTVDIELKEQNLVSMKILEMLGGSLVDTKIMNGSDKYKVDYNLSLVSGVYFILIETEEQRIIQKIIIN